MSQMFLITELMQGGDLKKRICNDRAVPRQTGWHRDGKYIILGIARGLLYLHRKGIVWFDCKPGNVLLDHTGLVAKIADFGLAKVLAATYIAGPAVRLYTHILYTQQQQSTHQFLYLLGYYDMVSGFCINSDKYGTAFFCMA